MKRFILLVSAFVALLGTSNAAPLMTYDTSASLLFTQVTINACTALTTQQKAAINDLIVGLKSKSLWTKFYGINIPGMGAGSCFGRINWVTPSQSLTETGSVTVTAFRSVHSDGTTGYWDWGAASTALSPCTQNSCDLSVWVQSFGANTQCARTFGNNSATAGNVRTLFAPGFSPSAAANRVFASSNASPVPAAQHTFYAIDRSGSSTVDLYTDGSLDTGGTSSTSTTGRTETVTEMASAGAFSPSDCTFWMFGISSMLTAQNHSDLYALLATAHTWSGTQ